MKKKIVFFALLLMLVLAGCSRAYRAEFKEEEMTVKVGETFSPEVIVRPSRFDYRLYSGNNALLSVEGTEVTALKTGIATLYMESGEQKDEMTVYVINESDTDINDPTFPDPAYVTFSVINYTSAQMDSPVIRVLPTTAGTDITHSFPTLTGYSLQWFSDEDGTVPVPESVVALKGEKTYYAVATALQNNVLTDENGRVTGLTYPNLNHAVYAFPDSYNGTTITGIADYAFYGDTSLETVVIPRTYTYIGKFAFAGCTSLKSVKFSEGSQLEEIGDFAFGPTYTEPQEEEEEEEDETLTYLDSLLDTFGLQKLTQAKEEEDITINEDYCASVNMTLPSSLKKIGSYAFYNCSSMTTAIPRELETIGYGAFRGSKIAVADLSNVREIDAYAFYECAELTEVINTEKVEKCGGYAFYGTPLYDGQINKKAVAYAGTVVIGCHSGKERVELKSATTLIADYAFNTKKQRNLTVYFVPGQKVAIGWQSFYVTGYSTAGTELPLFSDELFLAVGEGESDEYGRENPLLADHFCEKKIYTIGSVGAVNFGLHRVLKLPSGKYIYDKFIPGTHDGGAVYPEEIDLLRLPFGTDIIRVNSYAFESVPELKTLRLGRVETVAELAVSDCKKLSLIDFSDAISLPTLLSNISFQFSMLSPDCSVLVSENNYSAFRNKWEERSTARAHLRYEKEIELYINGVLAGAESFYLPYENEISYDGVTVWYSDAECRQICRGIEVGTTALYGKK